MAVVKVSLNVVNGQVEATSSIFEYQAGDRIGFQQGVDVLINPAGAPIEILATEDLIISGKEVNINGAPVIVVEMTRKGGDGVDDPPIPPG